MGKNKQNRKPLEREQGPDEKQHQRANPILTHLLALVLGSGAIWQYLQWDIQRDNQANDIRKQIVLVQEKLLDIANRVDDALKLKDESEKQRVLTRLKREADATEEEYNL